MVREILHEAICYWVMVGVYHNRKGSQALALRYLAQLYGYRS